MYKSYRSKNLTRASPEGSARSSCRGQREAGGAARGREASNKRHRAKHATDVRSKELGPQKLSLQLFLFWIRMSNINFFAYITENM